MKNTRTLRSNGHVATLADLKPGDVAHVTVRIVDNSPLEFLIVEFGGFSRSLVMRQAARHIEVHAND